MLQETDDDAAEFETETVLHHESNAEISIREGIIRLQNQSGRSVELNPYGTLINVPEASHTVMAKDIAFLPDGGDLAIGLFPTDGVVKGTPLATSFDSHVHAGPSGPPMPTSWLTPKLLIPGALLAGNIKVA